MTALDGAGQSETHKRTCAPAIQRGSQQQLRVFPDLAVEARIVVGVHAALEVCGKSQHDISDLADGPTVFIREFICDECVSSEMPKLESPMPMPAFSQSLDQSVRRAVAFAGRQPHERARPEHLLLSARRAPPPARRD
jgi:hypothetical protein